MGDEPGKKLAVGYARPPAEHRFRKGQSGNPKGRPKGAKNNVVRDPALQPTDDLILQEAYRPVTIREGDQVITLPAVQAAIRSLAISAMKGSRLSQRALAELVRTVEERKLGERLTMMENAFEYKQNWNAELERRRRQGSDAPDPIPHPDDLIIDMRSGAVRTEGPLDEREKAEWDHRIERRAAAQREVSLAAKLHKRARTEHRRDLWHDLWIREQYIFDLINDGLPVRYKAKLENRSYHATASREGQALEQFHKLR